MMLPALCSQMNNFVRRRPSTPGKKAVQSRINAGEGDNGEFLGIVCDMQA